ncbi:MAG: ABC-F family ATP-binding cassette domain-containing protein [Alphaproteobacteria bacterium]
MAAPPLLALRAASAGFGTRTLFTDIDVAIGRGERICLVGRNGSGKSTLLKALAGEVELLSGERFIQPGTQVTYLAQDFAPEPGQTLSEYVEAGGGETHRAAAMMDRLQLDPAQIASSLSGGEGRRAALARALATDPDILLLDEPTNHLDLQTIEWLEDELNRFKGGLLVISHDRAFLTRLSQATLWLDNGKMHRLSAGYGGFEEWSDQIIADQEQERSRVEHYLKAELRYMQRGVTARRRRNQRRVRKLASLREERVALLRPNRKSAIAADAAPTSGRILIDADGISKAYDGNTVIDNFSTRILRGDRIGIIGRNGAGKTTLLKLLTGELAPDSGTVKHGARVTMTHFDQHRASLDPDASLWDTLCPGGGDSVMVGDRQRHVVAYLRDFLFDEGQARSPVSSLSGGERNRLALAVKLAQPCNLMVLDEPTNDLDMDTLDLLEDMLSDFDGTLLLVSHDRDFLNRLVTSMIAVEGDGDVAEYPGGYDDYLMQRNARIESQRRDTPKASAPDHRQGRTERLSFREKTDLEQLPGRIAALESEIAALEEALADPQLFGRDRKKFESSAARLDAARQEKDKAEERWLEVEMKREALEGAA